MRHDYECEIYEFEDLLKAMMLYEEGIENYDTRKDFGDFIDDLIEGMRHANHTIGDLTEEARSLAFHNEALEDELYYERELVNDLREKIEDIHTAIKNARE